MLNKIIRFSLSNKIIVLVMAGMLLLWGMYVTMNTEVDIFPDLNAPTVVVMTEAPGRAVEEVETQITFPIETAINGATGIRRVRSASSTGLSVVWAEFDWDTDVNVARQTVNERLAEATEKIPSGVGTPVLGPQSSILGEILIIGLRSEHTSPGKLRSIADRTIRPNLLSISGVSQVTVIGGDVEEYRISLSPERMKQRDISLSETMEALESMNDNVAGGIINDYGNEYIIKGRLRTSDIDEISRSVIRADERGIVTLADIASVALQPKTPKIGVASIDTTAAVLITVTKQPKVGTINLVDKIDEELNTLSQTLPEDVEISTDIFNQSDFISNSIDNLQTSLFEGAIFVIIIIFIFLMNIRTTLISLVALPLSIIVTVIVLNLLGLTINTMSLGGIAIAIGSLVDDAIVDVENVYKRIRENRQLPGDQRRPLVKVVYDASCEVRLPILNSTLIIIASFLPLFFLSGIEGRMLIPLGISFIISLLASTVVALTVTPVLCSYLPESGKRGAELDRDPYLSRKMSSAYNRLLTASMRHKGMILGSTALLFIVALVMFFFLGRSFLPSFNEGSLTINISTLPGVSLAESDRIGREAEKIILSVNEIQRVARKTGRAELDEHALGTNVSEIEAPYRLDGRSREEMLKELRHRLSHIPGANIEIGQPISHRIDAMLSGTEAQIAIKVFGPDLDKLHSIATRIKHSIADVEGVVDVNVEQLVGRPQIEIKPRRDIMAQYGITNAEFSRAVSVLLGGVQVGTVDDPTLPYDITVRVSDAHTSSIDNLEDILIDSPRGKVPLSYIADITSTTGPNTINRENVGRKIVVSANVESGDLRGAVNDIMRAIEADVNLPEGYFVTYGGQFESEAQASRTLALASLVALIIIFLLLYHEYHNVKAPLIILINMPLALIGGVLMLWITGSDLNIPAIIGFISLMGIATRNGMLLLSYYNQLSAEGFNREDVVMKGSANRLRPIIMTALTSSLALIPLALRGSEPGNEIQSPMAIVMLGGLLTSTLLNIFVVPIAYSLTHKNK